MTPNEAHTIIKSLAIGRDPIHGGQLPNESLYQHIDVCRALTFALDALATSNSGPRAAQSSPANANQPWTHTEEQQLVEEFDSGISTTAMMQNHQRSRGAIQSRLVRLGKIDRPPNPMQN